MIKPSVSSKESARCSVLTLRNPCHLLATGFGSGLSPIMPGTMGSLAALPIGLLLLRWLPHSVYLALLVLTFIVGIYLCHKVATLLQQQDPGVIVWDEFVGIWVTLLALPAFTLKWILLSFLLFRLFDIWKPWPIGWCDKHLSGGLGIMVDDVIAGLLAACLLYLLGIIAAW